MLKEEHEKQMAQMKEQHRALEQLLLLKETLVEKHRECSSASSSDYVPFMHNDSIFTAAAATTTMRFCSRLLIRRRQDDVRAPQNPAEFGKKSHVFVLLDGRNLDLTALFSASPDGPDDGNGVRPQRSPAKASKDATQCARRRKIDSQKIRDDAKVAAKAAKARKAAAKAAKALSRMTPSSRAPEAAKARPRMQGAKTPFSRAPEPRDTVAHARKPPPPKPKPSGETRIIDALPNLKF
jgi:hypothetical protein